MTSPKSDRRPDDLIQAYLDGSLTSGEAEELLEALRTSPDLVDRLFESLRTDALIRRTVRVMEEEALAGEPRTAPLQVDLSTPADRNTPHPETQDDCAEESDVRRIREFAEHELELFLAEQRAHCSVGHRGTPSRRATIDVATVAAKVDRLMSVAARILVGGAVCAVLAVAVLIPVQHVLSRRVVATLGNSSNAKWSVELKERELRPGRISLDQGLAQLVFRSGAEVLVQAPSTFRLQSRSSLFLESGRLTAKVPKQARGFTVTTAEAKVVDFGTEFGVMVGTGDNSEVHVFDGRVTLASAPGAGSAAPEDLKRGDAATVSGEGRISKGRVVDRPLLFTRKIPDGPGFAIPGKRLNLADLVGGGNGLDTGVPGQGINPIDGQIGENRWVVKAPGKGFVRTPSLAFVDGVFVPGSVKGPMVISSDGIVSQDSTDATGFCHQGITNGALFQHTGFEPRAGRLGSVTYDTPEHPSLGMHANTGITFDLDKVRAALPEVEVCRFQSLCGISEDVARYSDGTMNSRPILVHFWVLVDGHVRFSKELAAVPSLPQRVNLPLSPADRFLSLMTTTSGTGEFCWGLFADPALELSKRARGSPN
jgi:hypothetical protein